MTFGPGPPGGSGEFHMQALFKQKGMSIFIFQVFTKCLYLYAYFGKISGVSPRHFFQMHHLFLGLHRLT